MIRVTSVKLIQKVITVSLETMKIVKGLPELGVQGISPDK